MHDVDLADPVRLELRHELGKRQVVARERIDAVEHDAADGAMVAVRCAEVVGALRVLAHDEIGAMAPDLARDVTPERPRVLDLAVGIAEERHLLDAERAGGVALLLGADRRQSRRGHRAIARALVAVGDDDERDVLAFFHEFRHRAAGAELAVVWVGRDHQHTADRIGHALIAPVESVILRYRRSAYRFGRDLVR